MIVVVSQVREPVARVWMGNGEQSGLRLGDYFY